MSDQIISLLMWAGNIVIGGCLSLIAWIVKGINERVSKVEQRLNVLDEKIDGTALTMANEYARRDEVEKKFDDLKMDLGRHFDVQMDFLKRIDEKLDNKADK